MLSMLGAVIEITGDNGEIVRIGYTPFIFELRDQPTINIKPITRYTLISPYVEPR